MILNLNLRDLYLRKPPFSFKAIKPGDVAIFSNGKALMIIKKIKPDNKGQSWYGLEFEGNNIVTYDANGEFDTGGECNNTAQFNIEYILKTGIKL